VESGKVLAQEQRNLHALRLTLETQAADHGALLALVVAAVGRADPSFAATVAARPRQPLAAAALALAAPAAMALPAPPAVSSVAPPARPLPPAAPATAAHPTGPVKRPLVLGLGDALASPRSATPGHEVKRMPVAPPTPIACSQHVPPPQASSIDCSEPGVRGEAL
jgi:hypothetical protein